MTIRSWLWDLLPLKSAEDRLTCLLSDVTLGAMPDISGLVRPTSSDRRDVFDAFFAAHRSDVLRYIQRRTSAPSFEDALAETFLVAWRRWDEIPADALPWLFSVARRVLANQRRGEHRRVALVNRLRTSVSGETEWRAPASLSPELADALSALSDKEREALLLDAWEGLDSERAAAVLGCTPAAFRARLHRARLHAAARIAPRSALLVSSVPCPEKGE